MRILFIANGNSEDAIAAEIISRLPKGSAVDAFPIIGEGNAYLGLCPLVGPRFYVPSQGWRHNKGSFLRDLRGGMLSGVIPATRFLRSIRGRYDKVVAVGDNVAPILCALAGVKIDLYLDVFKSGFAHSYSKLEQWLIKAVCDTVFCRDRMLADTLKNAGVDGRFAGNALLDIVAYGAYDVHVRRSQTSLVTLLPGSRALTGENLALQVDALRCLPPDLRPDVFVAVAKGLMPYDLAAKTGLAWTSPRSNEAADLGMLSGEGLVLHLATGVAGNLMGAADVVLSQAGTATQQALGLGKPVITFDRHNHRPKRVADEQAMMGDARLLVAENAEALAEALAQLLADSDKRARRGAIGAERLGPAGAAQKALEFLMA